ncbi:MAG: hypothetical protein ACYSU0_00035 [Planctomycetota bacterium]
MTPRAKSEVVAVLAGVTLTAFALTAQMFLGGMLGMAFFAPAITGVLVAFWVLGDVSHDVCVAAFAISLSIVAWFSLARGVVGALMLKDGGKVRLYVHLAIFVAIWLTGAVVTGRMPWARH